MSPPPVRLALCGSAGVGKSTLGRALANRLALPFVEEGMRRRLEDGLVPSRLTPDEQERLFAELWSEQSEAQAAAVRAHGGYVADRSAFDFAAAWLQYTSLHDRERTADWMLARLAAAEDHTQVVVLPFGGLPLVGDGVRHADPWFQFRFQAIVEGLVDRHARPGVRVLVPPDCRELAERVEFVLERVVRADPG